jgi:L,D-transpeptidase-like protein
MRKLSLIAALAAALFATAAQARVVIEIDKSAQRMSVSVDGVERHNWPVSTGRAGFATPEGSFTPFRLEEDHYSKEWDDAPMPHSIFFTKIGHAIHGSFETKKLGTPASAGCVRLAPPNAAKLFALVKEQGLANTRVVIDGIEPASAPGVARRGSRNPQLAPEADTSGVRVWSGDYADRPRVDEYAARMRRRYYEERWPPPLYDRSYGAPQYDGPRAYPYVGGYRHGY